MAVQRAEARSIRKRLVFRDAWRTCSLPSDTDGEWRVESGERITETKTDLARVSLLKISREMLDRFSREIFSTGHGYFYLS